MEEELNEFMLGDDLPPFPNAAVQKKEPEIDMNSVKTEISSIQDIMLGQEVRHAKTQALREELVDYMTPFIMNMDLDTKVKSGGAPLAEKTMLISNYQSLLNDIDNADKNLLASRIKLKDIETNSQKSQVNAAEFLSQMRKMIADGGTITFGGNTPQPSSEEIDKEFNKAFDKGDLVILDTELGMGGTMLPKDQLDSGSEVVEEKEE